MFTFGLPFWLVFGVALCVNGFGLWLVKSRGVTSEEAYVLHLLLMGVAGITTGLVFALFVRGLMTINVWP